MGGGVINSKKIFSPYIDQKLEIFTENTTFYFFKILAITQVDKEKTFINEFPDDLINADYLILTEHSPEYINVLALHKNDYGFCEPISSMSWPKEEITKYAKYLYKQNCYFPYYANLNYKDNSQPSRTFYLPVENQKQRLSFLKELKNKYQMSVCVDRYYEFALSKNDSKDTQISIINDLVKSMIESILNNLPITINSEYDTGTIGLLKTLGEAYNSTLYLRPPLTEKSPCDFNLAEIMDSNEKLQVEKNILQVEIIAKQQEIDSLKRDLETARIILNNQKNILESIKSLLNNEEESSLKQELTFKN